jgi:hypothetical protein
MWVLAVIVLLLIWGNLSRKSPNHPANAINTNPVFPTCAHKPTAGDNFNSGCTMVAGVHEPQVPLLNCDANIGCGPAALPVHIAFPIDPPPIRIQQPIKSSPVLPGPAQQLHCCHIVKGILNNGGGLPVKKTPLPGRIYQGQSGTKYRIFPAGGIGSVNAGACCNCGRCT